MYCLNSTLKKRLKGKGLLFQPKKGWGVIKVLSEIDENVPDRSRLVEFLNSPYRDKPGYRAGLRCHYVSKGGIIYKYVYSIRYKPRI